MQGAVCKSTSILGKATALSAYHGLPWNQNDNSGCLFSCHLISSFHVSVLQGIDTPVGDRTFFPVGNHIKDAIGYGDPTMWGPQDSVQLVYHSNFTMVYGTYNYI